MRDWDEALAVARAAVVAGVTRLVATPHYLEGRYHNGRAAVLAVVAELRERLAEAGLSLEVLPGCEAHASPRLPELVRAGEVLTVDDAGRYLLAEFPHLGVPPWADGMLFELQLAGVTPIIAHPERNRAIQREPEILRRWVERGMLVQLDAGSLTGAYGEAAQKTARRLLSLRLCHLGGSDCHRPAQAGFFAALAGLRAELPEGLAEAVVRGEPASIPEPLGPGAVRRGAAARGLVGLVRRLGRAAGGGRQRQTLSGLG